MQINYYNTYNSKITIEYEAAYINQTILFADKLIFDSAIPFTIELIDRLPKFSDENTINAFKDLCKNHKETFEFAETVEDSLPTIKKLRNLKSKGTYTTTLFN